MTRMTNEEIVTQLRLIKRNTQSFIADDRGNILHDYIMAIDAAIAIIDKSTPKSPYFEGDGVDDNGDIIYDTWTCPNCEETFEVDYEEHDYCPCCGQAILWEDKK